MAGYRPSGRDEIHVLAMIHCSNREKMALVKINEVYPNGAFCEKKNSGPGGPARRVEMKNEFYLL